MTIKFIDNELVIGSATVPENVTFRFSDILKLGGGAEPTWQDIILSGNTALTLVNAKADGLNYLKLFGGCEQRNLPSGYTQLESIHLGGNCYFDTGIVPTTFDYEIETKCSFDVITGGPNCMWGYMASSGSVPRWILASYSSGYLLNANTTSAISGADTNTHVFKGKVYEENATPYWQSYIDDTLKQTYTMTNIATWETNTLPIFIGARNNNGNVENYATGNFYYHKVTKAGVVIQNIVACKKADNTLGLYDLVTDTFLPNLGTGTLTAGANATPTPDMPIDIISNNGVIKLSQNLLDMSADNIVVGKYINNNGSISSAPSNFYNSKYITVKASTTYTWSASRSINYFNFMEYDSSQTFIRRTLIGSATTPAGSSGQITIGNTTAYILIGSNISGNTLTVADVQAINWQIEEGSTATDYRPYGITYIDGTTETVNIHGKNLSNGALENVGYTSTGGTSTSTTFCGNLCKIKCKEGEKYTVSCGNFPDGVSGVFINTWKTDGTFNLRQAIAITSTLTYTYTIPSGIGEVNFTLYKTGGITIGSNSWLQVEFGDTATDYEPYYNGGSATAEMLLKVGTYQDVQSVIDGDVTRNIGIKVFDGSENLSTSNATFTYAVSDRVTSKTPLICSHFEYSTKTSSQVEDLKIIAFSSTNIGFRYDACANTTEFKAWLKAQYENGTPVIVLYSLATATTETVTPQSLTIQAGTNYVDITQASIDNLPLEVSYKGTL